MKNFIFGMPERISFYSVLKVSILACPFSRNQLFRATVYNNTISKYERIPKNRFTVEITYLTLKMYKYMK